MGYSDNRRDFLKTLGVGAVASTLAFKAPYVFAKNTPTIPVGIDKITANGSQKLSYCPAKMK